MIKYKISSFITISDIKDSYDSIPQAYKDGYFIIHNEIEESDYLINSTIKYYIDKFFVGKTELEVLKEIPADVESTGDLLKEACARFFNFLCKTKILVPYNKAENIINTSTAFKEGDRFDSFSILKVLSSRSYTDVYQVADERTGREYVIKLLNKEKTAGITRFQKELKGMKQEYKMLQKVQHVSSINRAYDFKIVSDDQPYILLEYIDGRSLSGCMKEESAALTFNACLEIIEEIITAFSCLHENNILHGDIHSANIMVTAEKKVVIIDLGMSQDSVIENNELIKSGGAYYYMPPERINIPSFKKFSKDADLLSDVYQVGLLIYFVLYNALPFEGFTWEELAQCIKENKIIFAPVSFSNHPIPQPLLSIIKTCLHKDPSKRYASAIEMLADFQKYAMRERQLAEI